LAAYPARRQFADHFTNLYLLRLVYCIGADDRIVGSDAVGSVNPNGSALNQVSILFTARSFGYLIGSFIGGRLYDRFAGASHDGRGAFVIALLLASVPTIPLLWLLTFVILAVGFMESIVDVGANTLIVWVHRERVGPFMNGLHLFFAVGALLSPLLFYLSVGLTGNNGLGFWLLALLLLPVVVLFLPLPSPQPIVSRAEHVQVHPKLFLLVLVVIFFAAISGAESSFGGWIYTYGIKTNLLNQETATIANSAFWGAFMLGRVASIPLAARMRPRRDSGDGFALCLCGHRGDATIPDLCDCALGRHDFIRLWHRLPHSPRS